MGVSAIYMCLFFVYVISNRRGDKYRQKHLFLSEEKVVQCAASLRAGYNGGK